MEIDGSKNGNAQNLQILNSPSEPLAIIGMACRMPNGGNSPEEFWSLLVRGDSNVSSLEKQRFQWPEYVDIDRIHNGIDRAYLVDTVDSYDTEFFGISPKEAEMMDPQQRMVLELSWEALENAGIKPSLMSGSDTGVFIGASHYDYTEVANQHLASPEAFIGTGNVPCILANRISFFFNFKGPSFTIDTACSSSLFALSEAINAIEKGQCSQALVGAVGLILSSTLSVSFFQAGMTSRNSSCRPFDESSDGYLRGEGGGMLLIKKLSEAKKSGDNILATIKGCGVNHGGHGKTITSPNARAQANVISAAMENAEITPAMVNYIETHGTGTPVGDPIEFQGMLRSFKQTARKSKIKLEDNYCALGALKADIGHLESAAGMASLIKVIMAMKHKKLPANKRLVELNKRIKISGTPFYMVQQEQDWLPVLNEDNESLPLCAGISSFGFGGTNAHVILQQSISKSSPPSSKGPFLFVDTARSEHQLAEHIGKLLNMSNFDQLDSANLSFTLVTGRELFKHRVACVFRSQAHLRERLTKWLLDRQSPDVFAGIADIAVDGVDEAALKSGQLSIETCAATSSSDELSSQLTNIATLFVKGFELPYERLFDDSHQRIPLATYAFARKRYWLNRQYPGDLHRQTNAYSMLLAKTLSKEKDRHLYGVTFSGKECFFRDHRFGENSIFPGVAFLELARDICQTQSLLSDSAHFCALEFRDIAWLSPMIAHGETTTWINLATQNEDALEFQFYASKSTEDSELFCRGSLKALDYQTDNARISYAHEQLQNGDFEHYSAKICYKKFTTLGIDYGVSHRSLQQLYVNRQRSIVLAEIKIPESVRAAFKQLVLHPSILDAALQATIGFSLDSTISTLNSVNLPFALEKLVYHRPLSNICWVEVIHHKTLSTNTSDYYDLAIFDEQGRLCITMKSLEMRKAPKLFLQSQEQQRVESKNNSHILVPDWQLFSPPIENNATDKVINKTLVIGANKKLLQQIENIRDHVAGISLALDFSTADLTKNLAPYSNVDEIVLVLAQSGIATKIDEFLIARQYEAARFFLSFAQALAAIDWASKQPRLVLITQQSANRGEDEPLDVAYHSLHGMIGSFTKEFVNWSVKLIDMEQDQEWNAAEILALPFIPNGNVLQKTKGDWYQQVLVRENIDDLNNTCYKQGGVYLIIGGSGGLGELLTEHLIKNYQARVAWLGRSQMSEKIQIKIERLAAIGPAPVYFQGDASNFTEMKKIRENIIVQFGEINGLVHSAMVLDDAIMVNMSEDSLQRVLQSKVNTSVNMARTFMTDEMDFVLFFSSVNSYLKASGQSNYVAGCTFTDALAHRLRQDMPCKIKVVNWGYWGTLGAVAETRYQKGMEKMGFASIDPTKAMSFLDDFMHSGNSVSCYVAVANDNFQLGLPVVGYNKGNANQPLSSNQNLLPEFSSLIQGNKSEVIGLLRTYLLNQVAALLYLELKELDTQQLPFEEVVLSNFSLDSLLSSNLRYQILKDTGVDLPVQILIGDKVSMILEELYQQLLLNHVSSAHKQEDSKEFEQFVF